MVLLSLSSRLNKNVLSLSYHHRSKVARRDRLSLPRLSPSTYRCFSVAAGPTLHLFNSLTGKVEPLHQHLEDNKSMACYVCGPTVYAPAHLGHARTYVWLDVLRRLVGKDFLWVMNVTDVDDKILQRALENGESPLALARRYERDFWRDLARLHCRPPDIVTRVTQHVSQSIVPFIERLLEQGVAYETADGVYFDVAYYQNEMRNHYGRFRPHHEAGHSQQPALENGASQSSTIITKRSPQDFVLWKKRKKGESLYWTSPFGNGRPGWHIECSAMIESVQQHFQDTHQFVLHAGGIDLKFPHHENEVAQSQAYHFCGSEDRGAQRTEDSCSTEWIPHWVHTGHLQIDGLKMSKSLKNFVTIQELFDALGDDGSSLSLPGDDFRLWCVALSGSYRGAATFSMDRMREAARWREKLVRHLGEAAKMLETGRTIVVSSDESHTCNTALFQLVRREKAAAMDALYDDLNGAAYFDAVWRIVNASSHEVKRLRTTPASTDALRFAADTARELLRMVGFSRATTDVGMLDEQVGGESHVVGGERTLLDTFVHFRSTVRSFAVQGASDPPQALRQILSCCDDARDRTFPAMGVELIDSGVDSSNEETSRWRFCVPQSASECVSEESQPPSPQGNLSSVTPQELFRTGQYEGLFSTFDEEGIPLAHTDGTEVSKTQRKKYAKKLVKHIKRIASKTS